MVQRNPKIDHSTHTQFARLVTAIQHNNKPDIETLIDEDKREHKNKPDESPFLQTDSKLNNVLHLAAEHCVDENASTLALLIAHLNELKSIGVACATNVEGETPLHIATRFNSAVAIQKIVESLGKNAYTVARQVDNKGNLPLPTLFSRYSNSISDFMLDQLKKYTFYNPFEYKLSDKVKPTEIVRNDKRSCRLILNLRIADDLITKTRDVIKVSTTHPDSNDNKLMIKDIMTLHDRIEKIRTLLYFDQSEKYFAELASQQIGNCVEFAILALYYLSIHYPCIKGEVFQLIGCEKGNTSGNGHSILVIDRDPNSSYTDYKTWGPFAVVCDGWSGKKYPASDIPSQLSNHHGFNITDNRKPSEYLNNIIVPFNPAYNKFEYIQIQMKKAEAQTDQPFQNKNLMSVSP